MNLRWKSFDVTLIVVPIVLSIFGLVMVYSASIYSATERHEVESEHFFMKQLLALSVSLVVFFIVMNFNYKVLKSSFFQIPMVIGAITILLVVDQFGAVKGGARSWFDFGPINFQPAEFCKIIIILYLASVFHKKQKRINDLGKSLMPPVFILLTIAFLIILQPDYGTAAIILAIGFFIIICSGMNWFKISIILATCVLLVGLVIGAIIKYPEKIHFSEEKQKRITGYLHPFENERDDGFQLIGSLYAIGSGGMTGVGFGESVQKLGYLPEAHTDAIIAIIGEEFGFVGVAFVILCLATIVIKGILIAIRCRDPFGSMIAVGVSSMIGIQAFINLGGMSGLIPITGVTLSFVSYGGTSLLLTFVSIGLLVNVSMQSDRKRLLSLQRSKKI